MKGLLNNIRNWAQREYFVPKIFGVGCCIEQLLYELQLSGQAKHLDFSKDAAPNLLLITGPITKLNQAELKTQYESLTGKKYVIVVGSCANGQSPFLKHEDMISPNELIPVDSEIPGCAPSAETFCEVLNQLGGKR